MKATVLSARSGNFRCVLENGTVVDAVARKKTMSASGRRTPVITGDRVEIEEVEGNHTIESLHDRSTLISRGSEKRRGKQHSIIANVDHALVVFAADRPRCRVPAVDRYLIACEFQHLDTTLVFNKWDLADDESHRLKDLYEKIGYRVVTTSAQEGPEATKAAVLGLDFEKVYIMGPSGVGKSSILNACLEEERAATGGVNEVTGKGRHTTTHVELLPLGDGRYLADTPGLGHLSMLGIEPHNLGNFYHEFAELSEGCRYPDCSHIHEPGCQVIEAVGGEVHPERYRSYLDFRASLEEEAEIQKLRGKLS